MVRGARLVAEQASLYRRNAPASLAVREVTVNGGPGLLSSLDGKPVALLGFTIASGQVVELDIIADPERLVRLGDDGPDRLSVSAWSSFAGKLIAYS